MKVRSSLSVLHIILYVEFLGGHVMRLKITRKSSLKCRLKF